MAIDIWEYKVTTFRDGWFGEKESEEFMTIEDQMNDLGNKGWEMMDCKIHKDEVVITATFKRRKHESLQEQAQRLNGTTEPHTGC